MRSGTCPKCGSTQVAHNIPVADRNEYGDQDLGFRMVPATPTKVLGVTVVKPEYVHLRISLCGACGYAEMYCADMPKLLALMQQGYRWET